MTLIRKLVWVLCLGLLSINSVVCNAQSPTIETTQNIVVNTPQGGPSSWTNGVYQNALTCWSGGDPGYCGPNTIVRPGNNINFSYGITDLHQVRSISSVLPNSGTGLVVNGFNFSFTAKNGNGWDDGRVDQLSAYVKFYNTAGSIVTDRNYGLTYKFDWTNFNYSESFATPYSTKDVATVQYGFIGRDNNFWAGPYGPEINNINFSLKYSVDPCVNNQLYSTSCPGYLDALNKLVPQQTQPSQPTVVIAESQPVQQPQTVQQPVQSTSVVQAIAVSPSTQQSNSSTTAGGQVQLALNIIARNQDRDRQQQQQAVQQALDIAQQASDKAQQTAQQTAQQQSQQSQQQEVLVLQQIPQQVQQQLFVQVVPQTVSAQAQAPVQASVKQPDLVPVSQPPAVNTENTQQQQQFATLAPAQQIQVQEVSQQQVQQLQQQAPLQQTQLVAAILPTPGPTVTTAPQQTIPAQEIQTSTANSIQSHQSVQAQTVVSQQPQVQQVVTQTVQDLSIVQPQLIEQSQQQTQLVLQQYKEPELLPQLQQPLQDKTSPLSDLFYGTPTQPTQSNNTADTRRESSGSNELAAGISLDKIATQPQGYQQYTTLALQDAKFYQIREIYGKQTTVDNQRALRQLSSDRLHQQMVNQQYK